MSLNFTIFACPEKYNESLKEGSKKNNPVETKLITRLQVCEYFKFGVMSYGI